MARITNEELAIGQAAIKALLDVRIPSLEQKIDAVHIRISRETELSNKLQTEQSARIKGLEEDMHGNGKPGIIQEVREAVNRLAGLVEDISAMQIRQGAMEGKLEKLIIHHAKVSGEQMGQARAGNRMRENFKAAAPYLALLLSIVTSGVVSCGRLDPPILPTPTRAPIVSTEQPIRTPAPVDTMPPPSPTVPADFPPTSITPSVTPFASPTAIMGNPTSADIIEVTAFPNLPVEGWYTPAGLINVRLCASKTCPVFKQIAGGTRIRIYDMFIAKDTRDTWLTPDPAGNTWVAYIVDGMLFGRWEPDAK